MKGLATSGLAISDLILSNVSFTLHWQFERALDWL